MLSLGVFPALTMYGLLIRHGRKPSQALRTAQGNPRIYVAVTKRGGHIGWGSGGLGAGAWTDAMAAHFLQAPDGGRGCKCSVIHVIVHGSEQRLK